MWGFRDGVPSQQNSTQQPNIKNFARNPPPGPPLQGTPDHLILNVWVSFPFRTQGGKTHTHTYVRIAAGGVKGSNAHYAEILRASICASLLQEYDNMLDPVCAFSFSERNVFSVPIFVRISVGNSPGRNDNTNLNFLDRMFYGRPDPYTQMLGGQKVSPHHQGRKKANFSADDHDFWRDVHDPNCF